MLYLGFPWTRGVTAYAVVLPKTCNHTTMCSIAQLCRVLGVDKTETIQQKWVLWQWKHYILQSAGVFCSSERKFKQQTFWLHIGESTAVSNNINEASVSLKCPSKLWQRASMHDTMSMKQKLNGIQPSFYNSHRYFPNWDAGLKSNAWSRFTEMIN